MRLKTTLILSALVAGLAAREVAKDSPLTRQEQQQALARIIELVRDEYVFADVAARAAEALGERASAIVAEGSAERSAFIARVNAELKDLTRDKHVSVRKAIPNFDKPVGRHGIEKVERLRGEVGYLRVDRFFQADESRPLFDQAMDQLAGSRAMIIDLRENRGGGDALALLASYFLPERVLLNSLVFRKDETMEVWAGPSTRAAFTKVPVYVLVSGTTFSAGEAFAYGLQQRGRAVLIGERTKGGANPNRFFPVGQGLELSLSVGRTVNPVSGTNWEGGGVQPDVLVPADQALDKALEKALEKLSATAARA
ncbi:S41 family peptidase [Geothrix sp.]|jgi:C-terminal processing protease CtpA/Prc|uniref:S41 family peptidase n=1 Tax=Geothrix sp. TaxID=1962974 RepID=UPI0025C58EF6|nr:S41 family peptidase [Geothrix sp.]